MQKQEVVSIHGIGSAMQGVGRLADGRAVFVPGAIPGETVEIALTSEAGRYANARLLRVQTPSPERICPQCPHAGLCGGCAAAHMSYAHSLSLKATVVRDALARIGGQAAEVLPVLGMDNPWQYRNKMEYAVDAQGRLGFSVAGSHDIVPAVDCPLAEKAALPVAAAVEKWLMGTGRQSRLRWVVVRTTKSGEVMVVLSGDRVSCVQALVETMPPSVRSLQHCRLKPRPAHALDGDVHLLFGKATLREDLADMQFSLSAKSFFQVNRSQCETLLATAVAFATEDVAGQWAADVYCGVGTLSLALARSPKIQRVLGFEIVPDAIKDAQQNASVNHLSEKTEFTLGDAARTLPHSLRTSSGDSIPLCTAIIDPPRKGAAEEVLQALIHSRPKQICYVSCNPATLARDIAFLSSHYAIKAVQPVDMFPWTSHVETVVLLCRKESDAEKVG